MLSFPKEVAWQIPWDCSLARPCRRKMSGRRVDVDFGTKWMDRATLIRLESMTISCEHLKAAHPWAQEGRRVLIVNFTGALTFNGIVAQSNPRARGEVGGRHGAVYPFS